CDPEKVGRGQRVKIQIAAEGLGPIESVLFEPSDGVTIREFKELAMMNKAACWGIDVEVAENAIRSKRKMTIQTPHGFIRKNIEIISKPIPIISELKILKAEKNPSLVELTFEVAHQQGGFKKDPELILGVNRSGFRLIRGFVYFSVRPMMKVAAK